MFDHNETRRLLRRLGEKMYPTLIFLVIVVFDDLPLCFDIALLLLLGYLLLEVGDQLFVFRLLPGEFPISIGQVNVDVRLP